MDRDFPMHHTHVNSEKVFINNEQNRFLIIIYANEDVTYTAVCISFSVYLCIFLYLLFLPFFSLNDLNPLKIFFKLKHIQHCIMTFYIQIHNYA